MYLTPVGTKDLDSLFEEMVKDTKDENTEVHVTSLKDDNGKFSHIEFRSYEAIATAGIINATVCANKEGFDALVIGCFYVSHSVACFSCGSEMWRFYNCR